MNCKDCSHWIPEEFQEYPNDDADNPGFVKVPISGSCMQKVIETKAMDQCLDEFMELPSIDEVDRLEEEEELEHDPDSRP